MNKTAVPLRGPALLPWLFFLHLQPGGSWLLTGLTRELGPGGPASQPDSHLPKLTQTGPAGFRTTLAWTRTPLLVKARNGVIWGLNEGQVEGQKGALMEQSSILDSRAP